MKILIVDDDMWMTKVLNKIIMNLGYQKIYVANSGFDAVAIALKETPNLIFLDLMMPEMDGLTTLKLFKTIPATSESNIIICSANNDMNNITNAIKLGANDFISKPFTADTIKEKIDLLFKKMSENNV